MLVLEGESAEASAEKDPLVEAITLAKELMEQGKPASVAAKEAAKLTGRTKGEIYKMLIAEE